MKYIKIQNKGELDIRLFSLMGGTTKDNDDFKIGQWGSGLKYSLAWLIRNNVHFRIFSGKDEVKFTTEKEIIRDNEFNVICVNGNRTSVTDKMGGKDWHAWMIIRELWTNAIDEGEELKEITDKVNGEKDKTTFYIQLIPEFQAVLDNWSNYFAHNLTPMFENNNCKIYAGGDTLRLYKQGVLIYESKNHKGLFAYDIKDASINELREFRGSASLEIVRSLSSADKKVIQYYLENISEDYFEGGMDYDWFTRFGNQWKEVIGNSKIIHPQAIKNIKARGLDIDVSNYITVPETVYKFLTKQFEGVGALQTTKSQNEFLEIKNENLELRIKQGLAILETCNYYIHPDLHFVCGMFGDKRTLAAVNVEDKKVMFSEKLIDRPMFDVITAIIEENEHFKTGFDDCTRSFQQHFIDLFAKTLMDKNEIKL